MAIPGLLCSVIAFVKELCKVLITNLLPGYILSTETTCVKTWDRVEQGRNTSENLALADNAKINKQTRRRKNGSCMVEEECR